MFTLVKLGIYSPVLARHFFNWIEGGLLGAAIVMLVLLLNSNKKILAIPLVLVFLFFYQWQAGDVMHHRSEYIVNIEGEDSATDRINAWKGGLKIILSHPVIGVGLGTFVTALPDYIESRNMVAHNTLVQLTAESGLGAGLAYLVVVCLFFLNSIKIRRYSRNVPKMMK